MSHFVFLFGVGLLAMGKIHIGSIHAEGSVVRGAGILLLLPFISVLFMAQVLSMLNGGQIDFSNSGTVLFLFSVDIGASFICIFTAYSLLRKHSPKINESAQKPRTSQPQPLPTAQPMQRPREFPTLMGIAEAAHYLNVTEQDVMMLIEDGKIAAARINYQYRIARSVLDDYLNQ